MKRLILVSALILLHLAAIASAQVRLVQKSPFGNKAKDYITHPQAAINTGSGETLVYWVKYITRGSVGIVGRIVNAKGTTITGEINFVGEGWGFGGDDIAPASIVYNPKGKSLIELGSEEFLRDFLGLTNARVIADRNYASGYSIENAPFLGWKNFDSVNSLP